MKVEHYVYIAVGFVAAATAINFAVSNFAPLNTNTVANLNALLQKLNPLYYAGIVKIAAVPAPINGGS